MGKAVPADTRHDVRIIRCNDGARRRLDRPDGAARVEREPIDGRAVARNRRGRAADNPAVVAVEQYMPLARARAWWATRRYRQDYDEALSDALFGLAKAVRRGRPGPTFSAYASKTIEGAILRGIRDRSGLRAQYERGGDPPPPVVALTARTVAAIADGDHPRQSRCYGWSSGAKWIGSQAASRSRSG
jgi:Sigma-70 region 2